MPSSPRKPPSFNSCLRGKGLPRLDRLPEPVFTYSYAQPSDYRFCQDSVLFPWWLAERLRGREVGRGFQTLDVCAGCGVIGFELAFHLPALELIDFMELQEGFRAPFEANLVITGKAPEKFRFVQQSFERLADPEYRSRYDLIVANPPYFFPGDGKLTPIELKNRCRFFLDGSLGTLVTGIIKALKPSGEGYLLVKTGEKHGRDNITVVQRAAKALDAEAEPLVDIRGTWVMRVTAART